MTQTITEYLVQHGSPLLPKGWEYHVTSHKEESKLNPDRMNVIWNAFILDQSGQQIGRGFGLSLQSHVEKTGGKHIIEATNRAYHSLFRTSDPDYKHVLSYTGS